MKAKALVNILDNLIQQKQKEEMLRHFYYKILVWQFKEEIIPVGLRRLIKKLVAKDHIILFDKQILLLFIL